MANTQTKHGRADFKPHDAVPYSAPEPKFTAQSQVPHQWYVTTQIPETTIAAGTCFGPPDTGFYMATRVNSFMSTKGDMNFQVKGVTNMDLEGEWRINVTAASFMTTPSTIDITAAQTVTLVSGIGDPSIWYLEAPASEAGDDGVAGGAEDTKVTEQADWGHASADAGSPVGGFELALRLTARIIAGGVGCYHLFAAHSYAGKFAGAAVLGAAAAGAATGIAAFAMAQGDQPAIQAGNDEAAKLPPHVSRPAKGAPDIDLTAYSQIVGKAKLGIGWYTPKAISSTADVAILNHSPVIHNNADKVLMCTGGDFVWIRAGMEAKTEAISIVASAEVSCASSALVINSMFGGIAASVTGGIAASFTGGIAASVTGMLLCELSSFGVTEVDAGIWVNIKAGALIQTAAPIYNETTTVKKMVGVAKTGTWADIKNIAASVKEMAITKMCNAPSQTYTGASIKIG